MHRFALLTVAALGGCGGARSTKTAPPASRAPELAVVAGCSDATLRAFDPGVPGIERVAIEEHARPDPPLVREHLRTCELGEGDAQCQARAQREVLATDPNAVVGEVSMRGADVRSVPAPQTPPPVAVAPVSPVPLTTPVTPIEGRVVVRADGRSAVVEYAVPLPTETKPRLRWEAKLHWPTPPDLQVALARISQEAERAELDVLRYEVTADGVSADVACR